MYLFVFAKHPELGYHKKALFILLEMAGVQCHVVLPGRETS